MVANLSAMQFLKTKILYVSYQQAPGRQLAENMEQESLRKFAQMHTGRFL